MWEEFHKSLGKPAPNIVSDCFCDNKEEADECAKLVFDGTKRATASALRVYEKAGEKVPSVGDRFVVTDWEGKAICIVETIKVSIIPYNEITEKEAALEGEGDGSLAYWREAHIGFFNRQFPEYGLEFEETTPLVFEEFKKVYPS